MNLLTPAISTVNYMLTSFEFLTPALINFRVPESLWNSILGTSNLIYLRQNTWYVSQMFSYSNISYLMNGAIICPVATFRD